MKRINAPADEIRDFQEMASVLEGKKVFLVGEFADTGGAKTYFHMLLEFLLSKKCHLTVFSTSPISGELTELLKENKANWELWKPIWPENGRLSRLTRLFRNPLTYALEAHQLQRKIRRLEPKSSLILHSVCSPGRFLPIKKSEVPIIQIHHTYPRGMLHRFAGLWFGFLAKRSAQLVGVSDFLSDSLSKNWQLRRPHTPVTIWNTVGHELRASKKVPSSPRVVLSVGALNEAKAPFRFIEAAKTFFEFFPEMGVRFEWVGDGPLRTECLQLVEDAKLGGKVSFLGFSSTPEKLYRNAWLYLQLSKVDSMPLATLEAMRHGLPPIVSDAGGLPSLIIGISPELVIERGNPEKVAQKVKTLLDNSSEYNKLREATSAEYRARFSQDKWEREMLRLIFNIEQKQRRDSI